MRHQVDGRQFGRNTSHRRAMFRNIANAVIEREQIVTTVEKAKEAKRVVDRLITLGKSGLPSKRRLAFDRTRSERVVSKLFGTLADRYKTRQGGYTRVMKLSEVRRGDAANLAVLELVDHPVLNRKRKPVTAEQAKAAEGKAEAVQADPFKKMRKVFAGKKRTGEKKKSAQTVKKAVRKSKKV